MLHIHVAILSLGITKNEHRLQFRRKKDKES